MRSSWRLCVCHAGSTLHHRLRGVQKKEEKKERKIEGERELFVFGKHNQKVDRSRKEADGGRGRERER